MSRIIFVPQYPTPMRYQEWWTGKFTEEFEKAGLEVIVIGEKHADMMKHRRGRMSMFSPINAAIEFECAQIDEYMDLELKDDDVLFMSDISFPGVFGSVLFHKRPKRCFAFCHATSLNHLDYFEKDKRAKFPIESSHAALMDVVFVGSNYHEDKLGWSNTIVTRLPYPPLKTLHINWKEKWYDIISASRPTPQKVDLELEKLVSKKFSQVNRPISDSWEDYYRVLAYSKILLITAQEETFGYQVIDAVLNGCIPIAPNKFSYPELIPRNYLYDSPEELLDIIEAVLGGMRGVPVILCTQEIERFYHNIIQIMKG